MEIKIITPHMGPDATFTNESIAQFLYDHLDEFGDEKRFILKAIDYVFDRGGFLVVAHEDHDIIGAVVINHTGMGGYIPENILVYIAVHEDHRGEGIGKVLMKESLDNAEGDVALHVEPNNPAKFLYEKVGFTNKYLEMRWKQPSS